MKKWFRRTLYIIITLFLIVGLMSVFMLNYALKPQLKAYTPEESAELLFKQYPHTRSWLDSLVVNKALKDTFIYNQEGIKIHAYYVFASQPTSKTAVLVHGYTDDAIGMFPIGYMYNKEFDYNILVPDLQYHGESQGKAIQMGWKDRLDVLEWIQLAPTLLQNNPNIIVHGISMGAATTMMLSGEILPKNIKCFIEDCGYTSVWDEFASEAKVRFNLPSFPLLNATSWLCDIIYGWNFREASALNAVKKCSLPMFFIHGDKDTFVPTEMVYPLYEAKEEPKELWIVPNAAHAVSYRDNREEYTHRVANFIKQHMN